MRAECRATGQEIADDLESALDQIKGILGDLETRAEVVNENQGTTGCGTESNG